MGENNRPQKVKRQNGRSPSAHQERVSVAEHQPEVVGERFISIEMMDVVLGTCKRNENNVSKENAQRKRADFNAIVSAGLQSAADRFAS